MRRPYPSYRPSGAEWLGDLPEHWPTTRLKHSVRRSDIKVEPEDAESMPYVGLEHVTSWTGKLLPLGDEQEPESLCNSFTAGTVLFAKLRPYLAKAFDADFDGLCSTEFLTLEPFDHERRYLLFLLLTDGFISLVDSSTYGAKMPRANWGFIGNIQLPTPPLVERQAIAAFLDDETAKIDSLVTKKHLLLDRLAEYRTALITRTVTKGLPPEAAKQAGLNLNSPLKPSGVEWTGEVPEHWEIKRLSRSVNRSDTKVEPDDAGTVAYVGLEHVTSWTGKLLTLDEQQEPESLCNFFATGTVLFAKLRPYLAKAFDPDFEGLCSTEFLTLEPKDYERRYLLYLLLTDGFVSLVNSSTYGAKMPRANWEFIGNSQLPIPPLDEQHVIVEFLDRQMDRIDRLSSKVETAIERLQEYRTALITAAVTGKIDVRDHDAVEMGASRT